MLQRDLSTRDEAVIRPAAQLPDELGALGEASGAKGVALGDEAAGRVDDAAAAEGDVAASYHLVGFAGIAKAKGVEDDHFVGGKAIVEFAQGDVIGVDVGFGHSSACGGLGHVVADEGDGGAVKEGGGVGGEVLAGDLDGLGAEVGMRGEEGFGDEDGGSAAVGGGAALEFSERGVDGGGGEDLVKGVDVAELRVWVVRAVGVIDSGDLCEVGRFRPVFLHVFPPCIPKHLRCTGRVRHASRLFHHIARLLRRIGPILEERLQAPAEHLLEPNNHNTVGDTMAHHVASHVQASRAGGAVVIDIVYGYRRHPELIEDTLATGAVAVAVAGDSCLDVIVVDLGVEEGFNASFEAELVVVNWVGVSGGALRGSDGKGN